MSCRCLRRCADRSSRLGTRSCSSGRTVSGASRTSGSPAASSIRSASRRSSSENTPDEIAHLRPIAEALWLLQRLHRHRNYVLSPGLGARGSALGTEHGRVRTDLGRRLGDAAGTARGHARARRLRAPDRRRAGARQRAAHRRARAAVRDGRRHLVPRLRRRTAHGGGDRAGVRGADPRGGQRRRAHDDRAQGQGARVPDRHPRRSDVQAVAARRRALDRSRPAACARSSSAAGRRPISCCTATRRPRATRPKASGSPTSPPPARATCSSCRRSATKCTKAAGSIR